MGVYVVSACCSFDIAELLGFLDGLAELRFNVRTPTSSPLNLCAYVCLCVYVCVTLAAL